MLADIIPAFRTPLSLPFLSYLVPPELEERLKPGQLVTVPFRSKTVFGVVRAAYHQNPEDQKKLKTVTDIALEVPLLTEAQLRFLEEISGLYHTPLGFLLKTNLPPLQPRKLKALKKDLKETALVPKTKQTFSKPSLFSLPSQEGFVEYLKNSLSNKKTSLILAPEIPDLLNLGKTLRSLGHTEFATITSDLSPKEFFSLYFEILSGKYRLIIGTRRALFLPFPELHHIIMTDEANPSYKSWDMAPRYHTRDASLMLAQSYGAKLDLISPAPSVESYFFAKHKIYNSEGDSTLITGNKHYSITSMSLERHGGHYGVLSQDVEQLLENSNESVFLFTHRRGAMSVARCGDCEFVFTCPNCHRSLTVHGKTQTFECHHCKHSQKISITCPKCGSMRLRTFGAGSEGLEAAVRKLLPHDPRPIIRIDSDTTAIKKLENSNKPTIYIGTQYAWPLVPWNKLKTVVFVDADTLLFIPEYKMTEELWYLLTSAYYQLPAGGILVVQTNHTDHAVYQGLHTPGLFYNQELKQRKMFGYPPYNYLVKLLYAGPEPIETSRLASMVHNKLSQLTKSHSDITILAELPLFPYHQKARYWRTILAKVSYRNYKKSIKLLLAEVPGDWKVDLNPNTLLSL